MFVRRAVPLLILAAALLTLAGCGGDDDEGNKNDSGGEPAAAPESAKVDMVGFLFEPATVTISAGGSVEWIDSDAAPHTATADNMKDFDTGTLKTGQTEKITFEQPGTYPYFCLFHPFMHGTVEVVG